jgi:hypothetical protein
VTLAWAAAVVVSIGLPFWSVSLTPLKLHPGL